MLYNGDGAQDPRGVSNKLEPTTTHRDRKVNRFSPYPPTFLSGWSAPPRFCKAGEGNELLCSRRCRWSASCARATATTSATCKAPGCGNLGTLAARLREQARRGPHNTAVATDRDSTAAFIARPPHPVCCFQCTRAMPRGRRLPLWSVLCRRLTALQTTRRRASGSAYVLSHCP